ncbi:hypothetical protein MKY15_20740 [Sporosarcina sp. FSL K6-1540]|uniref:hypothetical protein n=1 Tax=Sporosarcina sp. FSL K6-1540 TaxID=2921555 RepID=UPI00315AA6F6
MKKLKDVGYVQRGMVLVQGEKEFEITKVMSIDGFGTYVHVNGDESVAIPFTGAPTRDDVFVKSFPL